MVSRTSECQDFTSGPEFYRTQRSRNIESVTVLASLHFLHASTLDGLRTQTVR